MKVAALSSLLCALIVAASARKLSEITAEDLAAGYEALVKEKTAASNGVRIVGGSEVASGRGFMAHLVAVFADEFGNVFENPDTTIPVALLCGGSVISSTEVLTAAHCFPQRDPFGETYQPVVRAVKVNTLLYNVNAGDFIIIDDIVLHPAYNDVTSANDVAIITLEVETTATPIDLIFESSNYASAENAGTSTFVAGWGALFEGGGANDVPDQLKEVEMPVLADSTCAAVYGSGYDSSVMLCSGILQGGADSCQGDSGGPLFAVPVGGGREVQVGIVSFGIGCAREGIPGVYTRVSAYQSWIESEATLAAPPAGNGASGFSTFVFSSAPSDMAMSVLLASVMMIVTLLH